MNVLRLCFILFLFVCLIECTRNGRKNKKKVRSRKKPRHSRPTPARIETSSQEETSRDQESKQDNPMAETNIAAETTTTTTAIPGLSINSGETGQVNSDVKSDRKFKRPLRKPRSAFAFSDDSGGEANNDNTVEEPTVAAETTTTTTIPGLSIDPGETAQVNSDAKSDRKFKRPLRKPRSAFAFSDDSDDETNNDNAVDESTAAIVPPGPSKRGSPSPPDMVKTDSPQPSTAPKISPSPVKTGSPSPEAAPQITVSSGDEPVAASEPEPEPVITSKPEPKLVPSPNPGLASVGTPIPGLSLPGTPLPGFEADGTPQPGFEQYGTPVPGLEPAGTPQPGSASLIPPEVKKRSRGKITNMGDDSENNRELTTRKNKDLVPMVPKAMEDEPGEINGHVSLKEFAEKHQIELYEVNFRNKALPKIALKPTGPAVIKLTEAGRRFVKSVDNKYVLSSVDNFFHKKRHYVFKPKRDIEVNMMCGDKITNLLGADLSYKRYYDGKEIIRLLGEGSQGSAVLLKSAKGDVVVKVMHLLSEMVIEANNLIGIAPYVVHPEFPNVFLVSMEVTHPIPEPIKSIRFKDSSLELVDDFRSYCLQQSFAKGDKFINSGDLVFPHYRQDRKFSSKVKDGYRFLILLLRQLQISHFTYNTYPLFHDSKIFGPHSYTLGHGDVHAGNIIIRSKDNISWKFPQLIDWGFGLKFIVGENIDVYIAAYNTYAFKTTTGVHMQRMLSRTQNSDFCEMLNMFIPFFHDDSVCCISGAPFEVCADRQKILEKHKIYDNLLVRHLGVFGEYANTTNPFINLYAITLEASKLFKTYGETWLTIANLFSVPA
ncbi:hypothetical protein SNEBB_004776 [Seison nebaliae]|nr:hypothetical protein SNEBB_004776 [Seison nebaliae]